MNPKALSKSTMALAIKLIQAILMKKHKILLKFINLVDGAVLLYLVYIRTLIASPGMRRSIKTTIVGHSYSSTSFFPSSSYPETYIRSLPMKPMRKQKANPIVNGIIEALCLFHCSGSDIGMVICLRISNG